MRANTVNVDNAVQPAKFVGEREVAAMSGLALSTIRKHRRLGLGFPAYRVGGKAVRYDLAEVEQIIRAGCMLPGA